MLHFENSFAHLGPQFYHQNNPSQVPSPTLLLWNSHLATHLNIHLDSEQNLKDIEQLFSGNMVHKSSVPLSMAYAGYQFGHFSPSLGDGRAHLLGELTALDHSTVDIHLKGSGTSQFSRNGDGKLALGPALREYLISEWMHRMDIPTTRSLAVVATGEKVYREAPLDGAVLTRASQCLIRVGHFDYFSSRDDIPSLEKLFHYCAQRFFPEMSKVYPNNVIHFFEQIALKQASLIAKWMSVGFIHGVMNTDNFSILGLTIDYGPCAFLDDYDPKKVFSSIDRNGRYAFGNQPSIAVWNMIKLAEALFPLTKMNLNEYRSCVQRILAVFEKHYVRQWQTLMLKKLGLENNDEASFFVLKKWLSYLEEEKMDYTLAHRYLSALAKNPGHDFYKKTDSFFEFYHLWVSSSPLVIDLDHINPLYIPRNHLIENVIENAYAKNFTPLEKLRSVLQNPFLEQENAPNFSRPPTDEQRVRATFCGT
jgi:uncharacterized protein YdiU (UPF0061 family)